MANQTLTIEDVKQLAIEEGCSVASVLTSLQAAAAKIGDMSTLDRLCEIKSEWLGL